MFSAGLSTFALTLASLASFARSVTIPVTVGGPGVLKFDPQFVTANPGDVVRFTFQQKNHTATQSTFAAPCSPAPAGFDSGYFPVADSVTDGFPVAELTIKDTTPVWVYCKQGTHCKAGMVFAVNPGTQFAAFQAAAMGGTPPASSGSASATVASQSQTATTSAPSSSASAKPPLSAANFSPSNITAQVGDTVTFEFRQKNHTVTSSTFASPCSPLASTDAAAFDSGFLPVADGATTFPTFVVQVKDTKPIWAYCRQSSHCSQGMVFSVNAVESGPNNFAAFLAKAKGSSGSTPPAGNGSSSGSSSTLSIRATSIVVSLITVLGLVL
ncbi:hypothetical protein BD779DRAFT_1660486 [Infundibulicybe gibba]|nr:hypothetical protein BD779DRAFT_1660486 [Infundibulicybe gibba]